MSTFYMESMSRVRQIDKVFDTFWLLVIDLCYETKVFFLYSLVSELNQKWSTFTEVEDPFWNFCDENSINKTKD